FSDWEPGAAGRLRALLVGQAFAAGLEVWDVHELAQAAPHLGRALGSADLDGLARLRLLWSLQPTRPWQECGPALTLFGLARYPGLASRYLAARPDLLLFQPRTDGDPILVGASGVVSSDRDETKPGGWAHFLRERFLPHVDAVLSRRSEGKLEKLLAPL